MTDIAKLFREWFEAEQVVSEVKRELEGHTLRLKGAILSAEKRAELAQEKISAAMKETGEYELLIPCTAVDYKIAYSTLRESVKADAECCPDEFVKIERKPRLKEIGDYLKTLREKGERLPNWATLEKGEPKLGWSAVKKGAV